MHIIMQAAAALMLTLVQEILLTFSLAASAWRAQRSSSAGARLPAFLSLALAAALFSSASFSWVSASSLHKQ